MPAGLIDAGEEGDDGTNRAALRELEEETGYGTDKEGGKVQIEETTPTMYNDPGLTGANMKMVVVNIELKDDAPEPVAKPEEGEFIEKYLVPVKGLYQSLKGKSSSIASPPAHAGSRSPSTDSRPCWLHIATDFQAKGFAVDARLAHLAIGLEVGSGKMGRL